MYMGEQFYKVKFDEGDEVEICVGTRSNPALEMLMLIAQKRPALGLQITAEHRFPTAAERHAQVVLD